MFIFSKLPTDVINYILDFWPSYDPKIHTWINAVMKGRLDWIKLLHKYNIPGYSYYIIDFSAYYKNLDIIKYLFDNGYRRCSTNAINYAAINNDFIMLKWFNDNLSNITIVDYIYNLN